MSELEQLEQQVLRLRPRIWQYSARGLSNWTISFWDKQIEADVAAGKLDRLIAEARAEFKAGTARGI